MTARIQPVDPNQVTGQSQEMFQAIRSRMGKVPNMMRTMAHSPALLGGYLGLSSSLDQGVLSPSLRQQIALYVSQVNHCEYCLSAHSLIGKHAGLSPDAILEARQGRADDPKDQALLNLVADLLEHHGNISDEQLSAVRQAGVSDAELSEVVGHVALTVLTNFFNQLSGAEVDFPFVSATLPDYVNS